MNHRITILCIVVSITMLSGCFDGSGSGSRNSSGERSATVDFTAFVKNELAKTSDQRQATVVSQLNFSFNDRNNRNAYDDLF